MSKKNNNIQSEDIFELIEALDNEQINQQIETLKMRRAELEEIKIMNESSLKKEVLNQGSKRKNKPYEEDVLGQFEPFFNDESRNLSAAKIKDLHEKYVAKDALKVFEDVDISTPAFDEVVNSPFQEKFINTLKKQEKEEKNSSSKRQSKRKKKEKKEKKLNK